MFTVTIQEARIQKEQRIREAQQYRLARSLPGTRSSGRGAARMLQVLITLLLQ